MRRLVVFAAITICCVFAWVHSASAEVRVTFILKTQTMYVALDGKLVYTAPIATSRVTAAAKKNGWVTPEGSFTPTRMDADHVSDEFGPSWCRNRGGKLHRCGATMYYSIFFSGGKAIHAGPVGKPSHGCIHLKLDDAKWLYGLVERYGQHQTLIDIFENSD